MKRIQSIRLFCALGVVVATALGTKSTAQMASFPVLQALLYANMPDLTKFSVRPAKIAYSSELWPAGDNRQNAPSTFYVQKVVHAGVPDDRLIIDIEHWPLTGNKKTVDKSIKKYIDSLERFRSVAPSLNIGLYAMLPARDYWRAILAPTDRKYKEWQRENDALIPIVGHVDTLYPSLYTFYPDQAGWVQYAKANISEAKRIAPGKPIFCFLWPQYHDSTALAYQLIPSDYWRLQLQTCRQFADGVVIWGGVGLNGQMNGWLPWDPNAAWWQATMQFVGTSMNSRLVP